MFYNYFSRIQYAPPPPQPYQYPRMTVKFFQYHQYQVYPHNMNQLKESVQLGFFPLRNQQIMKCSTFLEQGAKKRPTATLEGIQRFQQKNKELYLYYDDGCIYRGQGVPPKTRQGLGVLFNEQNSEVYSGEWVNNKYEGFGILNNQSPSILKGPLNYKNLNLIGDGWRCYKGYFKEGKMHGEGIMYLTNGEKFEGNFFNGMIHGRGKFIGDHIITGFWAEAVLQ